MARVPESRIVRCSADYFFERGAGKLSSREMKQMTVDEIYRKSYGEPRPHHHCPSRC
jgi:hypothetical protein